MKRIKKFSIFKAMLLICWLCIINYPLFTAPQGEYYATILPDTVVRVEKLNGNTETKPGIRELNIAADDDSNPVKSGYHLFDTGAIPPQAFVASWTLRLCLKSQNDPQGYQFVKIYNVNNVADVLKMLNGTGTRSFKAIGSAREVNDQTPVIDFEHKIKEKNDRINWLKINRSGFALMLASPSEAQDYAYYLKAEDDNQCTKFGKEDKIPCYNVQPKLIVKYYMPIMRPRSDWSQYNYDPQHTGRTPWKIYLNPNEQERKVQAERKIVYSPNGYIKGDPVVYDNDLFFHTQLDAHPSGKKFFITAVSGTRMPLWDRDVEEVVKFQPFADHNGLLYVVTENHFLILDLDEEGKLLKKINWYDLLKTKQVGIRSTPTIGYNSSLYFSTNRGIYALTPYPDLEILWNYASDENSFGRITLSEDEGTAYVIDCETGELVAIDAADGTEKWRKGEFLKNDKNNNHLPVPVVGKNGYIYVTNGFYTGDYLQIFNERGDAIKRIMTKDKISQPVIDSKGNAYFMQTGRGLCKYDPNKKDTLSVARGSDKLNASSILVMNGNDNVYVVDRFSDPQLVKGYTADLKEIFALGVPQTKSSSEGISTNFKDNLLVAPDGTLYTCNDNHLFAITIRDSSITNLKLKKDMIKSCTETIFHAVDSLTILENVAIKDMKSIIFQSAKIINIEEDVSIDSTCSVVFKSGVIGFKPGFSVKKGACLICKTGF